MILSLSFIAVIASDDISDDKWLKKTDDIDRLANVEMYLT